MEKTMDEELLARILGTVIGTIIGSTVGFLVVFYFFNKWIDRREKRLEEESNERLAKLRDRRSQ